MAPNIVYRKVGTGAETSEKTSDEAHSKRSLVTEKALKEHNGANGSPSWIAIKDKVYDVTKFGQEHPGGNIIFTHAGLDATDVFNAFHPAAVYKWLPRFYVGELVKDSSSNSLTSEEEAEYRRDIIAMKTELMKARAFESSKTVLLLQGGIQCRHTCIGRCSHCGAERHSRSSDRRHPARSFLATVRLASSRLPPPSSVHQPHVQQSCRAGYR